MPRNFDRRVEAVVPVDDRRCTSGWRRCCDVCLADNRQAWELQADGSYVQRTPLTAEERGVAPACCMRDPWGLDRSESRYVTQEFRAAALAPAPEPHQHASGLGNGRKRKIRRTDTETRRERTERQRGHCRNGLTRPSAVPVPCS